MERKDIVDLIEEEIAEIVVEPVANWQEAAGTLDAAVAGGSCNTNSSSNTN